MILRINSIALLCLFWVCLPFFVVAQSQNIPGRVLGLSNAIPEYLLPMTNNDSLQLIDSLQGNAGPSRIAIIHHVEINFKNQAERYIAASGERVYRLRLSSPNALGLLLQFNEFYVAVGAQFFIYGADTTEIIGPLSNSSGGNGTYVTAPISGNSIILELIEPGYSDIPSSIELFGVGHVYAQSGLGLGESSLCNNDVNCPEGSYWVDQKRAAVKLRLTVPTGENPGIHGCSGVMLNNSELDGTLYLLTAFHCLDGDKDCLLDDAERSAANLLNVIFNYESDYCNGPLGFNVHSVTGAQLLAYNWESDYALLKLQSAPSAMANVFLAGWDSRDVTPQSGVGIHHPLGDLKKISIENEMLVTSGWNSTKPGTTQPDCQNTASHHWKVQWNHFEVDHNGVTEPMSSGSPFFNQEGRVIGQLHGGNTDPVTCMGPIINGVSYPGIELYGKLSSSWHSGANWYMSNYLDPNQETVFLDGVYLNTIVPPPTNDPTIGSGSPGSQTPTTGCQWGDGERFCTSFNEHIELIDRHWDDESGLKRAYNTITAEDVTIVNESSVRFEAKNAITLKAPFSVDASRFTAILGDCECHCPATLFFDDIYCEYDDDGAYVPGGRYANPDTIIQSVSPALYPNPTTGLITYNSTAPLSSATIMDLTGRALHTVSLSSGLPRIEGQSGPSIRPGASIWPENGPTQHDQPTQGDNSYTFDLSPYRPGTYLLRIQCQSGKVEVHRIIRQ